jgi:predicted ArsR family transcriptional regulator
MAGVEKGPGKEHVPSHGAESRHMPDSSRRQSQRTQQRQARALGDRTRFAIFWRVADAGQPLRVAELVEHLGLNHQGVRQHLAKLVDAGLLVEEIADPVGSGRPPLQYRLSPEAAATWVGPGPYAEVSVLLLRVLQSGTSPRRVAAEAGRSFEPLPDPRAEPLDQLEDEMARRGFEPQRAKGPSSIDIVLRRCAFEVAAHADPGVICELHLGLAEGITEALGGSLEVIGLVANDPAEAGCRLRLRPAGGATPLG